MFEWSLGLIAAGGLLAVALLTFAESAVPPIPSEVIMPLAGLAAAQGRMSLAGVVIAGTLGALAGATVWYLAGRCYGEARLRRFIAAHGGWVGLEPADIDRSSRFFQRWGACAVFFGRLAPGVRTFVSVPAGLHRMPPLAFLTWSLLGTALWTSLLAAAGYGLAGWLPRIERWLDPLATAVVAGVVALYLFRTRRRLRRWARPYDRFVGRSPSINRRSMPARPQTSGGAGDPGERRTAG
jgi:membrane protein DedA with SNARE-associated domain